MSNKKPKPKPKPKLDEFYFKNVPPKSASDIEVRFEDGECWYPLTYYHHEDNEGNITNQLLENKEGQTIEVDDFYLENVLWRPILNYPIKSTLHKCFKFFDFDIEFIDILNNINIKVKHGNNYRLFYGSLKINDRYYFLPSIKFNDNLKLKLMPFVCSIVKNETTPVKAKD